MSPTRSTGAFVWLQMLSNRGPVGAQAGRVDARGYVAIGLDRRQYKAHRLAWLYMTGEWPALEVDHRDADRANNAWLNLRQLTHRHNMENERKARSTNKSGLLGVHQCRATGRYRAAITVAGRCKQLGRFDTPELAHQAYVNAKRQLHAGNTL